MKTHYIPLLLLFFLVKISFGQSVEELHKYIPRYDPPKSPNASSFERYTAVPGNFQTGQVNPSVPLMNFSIDGLLVSLTLNYSNTGLKVSDVASWVGLGWNLNVGGIITRDVKGLPDDCPFGLMNPYYANQLDKIIRNQMSGIERWNYFDAITKQTADTEHDVFTYDILGVRGSFYINKFDKCVQFSASNNKIEFTKKSNGELDSFTVIDVNGNMYLFTIKEESITSISPATDNYYNNLRGNTWYLSEVKTRNGEEIYFEYSQYQYSKIDLSETRKFGPPGGTCDYHFDSFSQTYITNIVNVYQLSRISWKNGYVVFSAGSNRTDLHEIDNNAAIPFLAGLSLYKTHEPFSATGRLLKRVSFSYLNGARLFLKKIDFIDVVKERSEYNYQFNYINENSVFPSYKVSERSYRAQDYWGYYNGILTNNDLCPTAIMPENPLVDSGSPPAEAINLTAVERNNRVPDPLFSAYGILQQVIYPTGGKTVFSYEGNKVRKNRIFSHNYQSELLLNTLRKSLDSKNDTLVTFAGIRVNKIDYYSNSKDPVPSKVTTIVYNQSSFYEGNLPFFYNYLYKVGMPVCEHECTDYYVFALYSSSIGAGPAPVVQYSEVTEFNGLVNKGGQIRHSYELAKYAVVPNARAPYLTPLYFNWHSAEKSLAQQTPNGSNVRINETENKNVDQFDNAFNVLEYYDHDFKVSLFRNDEYCIFNFSLQYNVGTSPNNDVDANTLSEAMYKWDISQITTEKYLTTKSIDTVYNKGIGIGKTINYNFDPGQKNLLLPNSTSTIDSRGDSLRTLISYPQDYFPSPTNPNYTSGDPSVNGLVNLINKNLLAVPIERIEVIRENGIDYVVSGFLTTFNMSKPSIAGIYKVSFSKPVLLSDFTKSYINANGNLVYDTRYRLERKYYWYNALNQPLEFSEKLDGVRHALLWDYNSTYQIAEVTGAGQADIAYTSFEADGSGNWSINTAQRAQTGFTGSQSFSLSSVNSLTKSGLSANKAYIVSYWTTGNNPVEINGTQAGYPIKGATSNGWTYYEHLVKGQTSLTLQSSVIASIDEVRLYPEGAEMTTYTYSPLIGITSVNNAKNEIIYYEYDALSRLLYIKDQYGNIMKRTDYHYAVQ